MINMKRATLVLLPLLILTTGCKTQEEIQREQIVDNMSLQMVESQKIVANASTQLQGIEEKLSGLSGTIEENNRTHKLKQESDIKLFNERLLVLEETNKATLEKLDIATARLDQQDKFLKEVLKTLKGLSSKKSVKKKKKSKKKSAYDQAMYQYSKKRYTKAKRLLENLINKKRVKGNKKARVLHNLGMIAYIKKKNQDAAIYFGKLFTEHSKSSYNANGLLFLAKTFKRQKQNDQAKQTLEEMINRFPKSKQVKEAKKILKTL